MMVCNGLPGLSGPDFARLAGQVCSSPERLARVFEDTSLFDFDEDDWSSDSSTPDRNRVLFSN